MVSPTQKPSTLDTLLKGAEATKPPGRKNDQDWEEAAAAIGRFLTGNTLDGLPQTDRTWTHRGTTSVRADGRAASRFAYWPRWQTLGARWAAIGTAAGTGYAYVQDPTSTLMALQVSGAATVASTAFWAGFRGLDGAMTWRHRRDWVWPLHIVLRDLLSLPEGTKPSAYMSVPVDFNERSGDVIRIELPANWAGGGELERRVSAAVISKLALQDVKASARFDGRNHYMVFKQSERAPERVYFADPEVRRHVEQAKASAPFLGLSHRGVPVAVSLDEESPHIMYAAAPGAGKSEFAKALGCQILHNGGINIIIDFKKTSHPWAFGLPNVVYVRSVADAHHVFMALAQEGNRRMAIAEENVYRSMRKEKPLPMGPRILITVEEANTMRKRLTRYWTKVKPKQAKANESPAVEALGELLFMGRSQLMHVFMIGQSLTAQTVGGPEMRETFTARILARYTQNAWRMLVPEVSPIPKTARVRGRCQIVLAGTGSAVETQGLYMTNDEGRAWATSGTLTPAPAPAELLALAKEFEAGDHADDTLNNRHMPPFHLGEQPESDTGTRRLRAVPDQAGAPQEETDPDAPIGLADAAATICAGVAGPAQPGVTTPQDKRDLMALRNARNRDKQFPSHAGIRGREKLYKPSELEFWMRNRISAPEELDELDDAETGAN